MINKVSKNVTRQRRHARVRAKVSGTSTCPRLNVFRSNSHIFAQIIDDTNGTTLVSSSSLALKLESSSNIEAAGKVGTDIAKKALEKNAENRIVRIETKDEGKLVDKNGNKVKGKETYDWGYYEGEFKDDAWYGDGRDRHIGLYYHY